MLLENCIYEGEGMEYINAEIGLMVSVIKKTVREIFN